MKPKAVINQVEFGTWGAMVIDQITIPRRYKSFEYSAPHIILAYSGSLEHLFAAPDPQRYPPDLSNRVLAWKRSGSGWNGTGMPSVTVPTELFMLVGNSSGKRTVLQEGGRLSAKLIRRHLDAINDLFGLGEQCIGADLDIKHTLLIVPARSRVDTEKLKGLKVYSWHGYRAECPPARNGSRQTREIVAARSGAAAARAAGETSTRKLFNFSETGNDHDIQMAMTRPGVVFWKPLDASHSEYRAENPEDP